MIVRFQWRYTPRLPLETSEFSPWETLKSDELRWCLVFVTAERRPTFKTQRKQQKSGENKSHSSRLPRFPERAQETSLPNMASNSIFGWRSKWDSCFILSQVLTSILFFSLLFDLVLSLTKLGMKLILPTINTSTVLTVEIRLLH